MLEMTAPDDFDDVDELATLRAAGDRRRAVRRQIADAVVDHGQRSTQAVELRQILREVTAEWADLIRQAAAAGHPLADIARAAGVAPPSLYYRLRRPVLEDSVHRPQGPGADLPGVGEPAPAIRISGDHGLVDDQSAPLQEVDRPGR